LKRRHHLGGPDSYTSTYTKVCPGAPVPGTIEFARTPPGANTYEGTWTDASKGAGCVGALKGMQQNADGNISMGVYITSSYNYLAIWFRK